ncbi:phage holin family protein [Nitriliruptor alkaliphilus]|uniref:phage holin family protein n=1 Tax=Nitriliruptor alkaliphilus TaxID=427918 RepID=UPI0006966F09|nr:phage holin family protein [Nitriliruptor alkaliphilus]
MAAPGSPGQPGIDDRDAPEVIRSLVDNTQLLVKKEIELAKLEIKQIVTARLMAVGFFVVAGVLGLYLLGFALVTAVKGFELVVAEWLAWLIVTGIVAVLVAILLLLAKRKLTTPSNTPETTKQDVQETIDMAKRRVQQ